jgi:CheY-like chemotaxis protein
VKVDKPILLVEDDVVSHMLMQRALASLNIVNRLHCAGNGEEAIRWLKSISAEDRPCIILVDLNMPKMNGLEFLRAFRRDDSLRTIPVIVLTTSKEPKDVKASYELGAAGYLVKPVDYLQFIEVMKAIDRYWSLCEQAD